MASIEKKIAALQPIAEKYERSFRTHNVVLNEEITLNLESTATGLWNSVSVVMKNIDSVPKNRVFLLCRCKMFSAILLSLYSILKLSNEVLLRSFKCFLSVLKSSLDCSKDFDGADGPENFIQKVQEHGDTYLSALNQVETSLNEHERDILLQLTFEFCVLNFEVFFKDGDFDTAKIYISRVNLSDNISRSFVNAELVMELVRVIYNTTVLLYQGEFAENMGHIQEIIHFLKVSQGYLELPVKDLKAHVDYPSIKFSVSTFLVKCLLSVPPNSVETELVREILQKLQNEYPKKILPFLLNISLLKLEDLSGRDESISEILMRIITSVDISDNFDSIISCIKEFSEMNIHLALRSLDYMFMSKLEPERDHELVEKTILSRFFITTQSKLLTEEEIISSLVEYCNHMEKTVMHTLSTQTTSCVITLLWNGGKKSEKKGAPDNSIQFYKLILRQSISGSYVDKGKVQRALLGVYLKSGQFQQAATTLEEMSVADRRFPITQLLALKINLHQNDEKEILKNIIEIKESGDTKCVDYLLFGISLCKDHPEVLVKGIKLLFDKLSEGGDVHAASTEDCDQPVQILCIIRYAVQVIVKLLDGDDSALFSNLDSMEGLIQKALEYMRKIKLGKSLTNNYQTKNDSDLTNEQPSVDELEWLASVAYNVTVKFYNSGGKYPRLSNFAKLAVELINLIPYRDFVFPKMFHYTYWRFKCSCLSLSVEKDLIIDQQMSMRDNAEEYRSLNKEASLLLEEIVQIKTNREYTSQLDDIQLRKLDDCLLEATTLQWSVVLSLREPSKINGLLEKSKLFRCEKMECMLISSVLSSVDLPNKLRDDILTGILKRNLEESRVDNATLCTWLRNLLELPMSEDDPKKYQLTILLFTKIRLDNTTRESISDVMRYELETIATLAWNCGVNSIISEKRDEATKWCKASIEIARLVGSGFGDQLKNLWCTLSSTAGITSVDIDNL